MREDSVHMLLCALFHWHFSQEEYGYPPINVLHRIAHEGHVSATGRPGHRVLCPDMDPSLMRCQRAFNCLPLGDKIVVVAKHMPQPLKEDGTPVYKKWGDIEKARYLNEPVGAFKNKYKQCIRRMQRYM